MISVHKNTELGEMSVFGNSKDLLEIGRASCRERVLMPV